MFLSRFPTCNNPPYSHRLCFGLFYTVTPPLHGIFLWKILKERKSEQSKSLTDTTLTNQPGDTDLEKKGNVAVPLHFLQRWQVGA